MRNVLVGAMMVALASSSAVHAQSPHPIMIGGPDEDGEYWDACASYGEISGLSHIGDGFLAVRNGPAPTFNERDRLYNGFGVYICVEDGDWIGIVYDKDGAQNCNVSTSWQIKQAYTGPCKWGWVHKRFVTATAG